MVRLSADSTTAQAAPNTKIKVYKFGSTDEVDMREEWRGMAAVDVLKKNGAALYKKKYDKDKRQNENDDDDAECEPCPVGFLDGGVVSATFVRLMRGLQQLDPSVSSSELITLAAQLPPQEMWLRSKLNMHTPLEAALAGSFAAEFGSGDLDAVAETLVARGAPLTLTGMMGCTSLRGGPTTSPLHMLFARGDFAKAGRLIQKARAAGRYRGDANEVDLLTLIFGSNLNEYIARNGAELDDDSPAAAAIMAGHAVKLLQAPVIRELMAQADADMATKLRARIGGQFLRVSAMSTIATSPEDFAKVFQELYAVELLAGAHVAGLPLHRAVNVASPKTALPAAHVRALLRNLPREIVTQVDKSGRTVLHAAIEAGYAAVIDALLECAPELAAQPTMPPSLTASETHRTTLERLRQAAIKNRSLRWGCAVNADPATFVAKTAVPRKFPLQLALERRGGVAETKQIADQITTALCQQRADMQFASDAERHEVLDTCMAEAVSKKMTHIATRIFQTLFRFSAPSNNAVGGIPFVCRRAIHAAVVHKDEEFINFFVQQYSSQGVARPLDDFVFNTDVFKQHIPLGDGDNRGSGGSGSGGGGHSSGQRARFLAMDARPSGGGELIADEHHVEKMRGVVAWQTPLSLAIERRDLRTASFLIESCGAAADGAGIAGLYAKTNGSLFGLCADESSEPLPADALPDLAAAMYVSRVLQVAADTNAPHEDARQKRTAADDDGMMLQLILGALQSRGGMKPRLDTLPKTIRAFLLEQFLFSRICLRDIEALERFIKLLGFAGADPNEPIRVKPCTLAHLVRRGFSEWDKIPRGVWKHWLVQAAENEWWYDDNDDEDEEDEGGGGGVESKERFLAMGPVGENAAAADAFDSQHILCQYIFGGAAFMQQLPHIASSGFSAGVNSTVTCITPRDGTRKWGLDAAALVKSAVAFAKYAVGNFFAAADGKQRVALYSWAAGATDAMWAHDAKSVVSDTPMDFYIETALQNRDADKKFKLRGAAKGVYSAATALQFLQVFGDDLKAQGGVLLSQTRLQKFCFDDGVLGAAIQTFGDDAKTELLNFATAAGPRVIGGGATREPFTYSNIILTLKGEMTDKHRHAAAAMSPDLLEELFVQPTLEGRNIFECFFINSGSGDGNHTRYGWFFGESGDGSNAAHVFFNKILSVARNGGNSSGWFDEWLIQQMAAFLGNTALDFDAIFSTDADSSQSRGGGSGVLATGGYFWAAFDEFCVRLFNASSAAAKPDVVPRFFAWFLGEALHQHVSSATHRLRFWVAILRVAFASNNCAIFTALADARAKMGDEFDAAAANQVHEELCKCVSLGQVAGGGGGGDDDDDEDEEPSPTDSYFSWGSGNSQIYRGGLAAIAAVNAAIGPSGNGLSRTFSSYLRQGSIDGLISASLDARTPVDARVLTRYFRELGNTTQMKLVMMIIESGASSVATNETAALALNDNGAASLLEALFDELHAGAFNTGRVPVAMRIMSHVCGGADADGFFARHGAEVPGMGKEDSLETVLRAGLGMGNRDALDFVKTHADRIRAANIVANADKYGETARAAGFFVVSEWAMLYEEGLPRDLVRHRFNYAQDVLKDDEAAYLAGTGEGDCPDYEGENAAEAAEDDDDDDEYGGGGGGKHTPVPIPVIPRPFARAVYTLIKNSRPGTDGEGDRAALRAALDALPPLNPTEVSDCVGSVSVGGEVAPALCSDGSAQRIAACLQVQVPFPLRAIAEACEHDADKLEQLGLGLSREQLDGMKSYDVVRFDVSSVGGGAFGGGGAGQSWADVDFDTAASKYVVRVRTSTLAGEDTPSQVELSEPLRRIYDFVNTPKLFSEL